MVDMTEKNSFTAGLDLCVGLTENSSITEEQSWSWQPDLSPSTYMASEEVQGINNRLGMIDSKLNILVAGHTSGEVENSNGPVAKRVRFCPPLCSFLSS